MVNGVTYTKQDQSGLNTLVSNGAGASGWDLLPKSCTSGVTDMSVMFSVRGPVRYFFSLAWPLDALTLTPRGHPPVAMP